MNDNEFKLIDAKDLYVSILNSKIKDLNDFMTVMKGGLSFLEYELYILEDGTLGYRC